MTRRIPIRTSEDDPNEGYPAYQDRVLAYVDILGWKERIHESQRAPQVLRPALRALGIMLRWKRISTSVRQRLASSPGHTAAFAQQVSQFSDLIAISCRPTRDAILHLLYVIQQYSNRLLITDGLYTRGAVVRGSLIHTDSILLGPALVEAYKREQTKPGHPRIQISPSTLAIVNAPTYPYEGDGFAAPILRDSDGVFFLDTLQEARDTVRFYTSQLRSTATRQMRLDRVRLKGKALRSVMEKHRWMIKYIQMTAQRFAVRAPTAGYWARVDRWP